MSVSREIVISALRVAGDAEITTSGIAWICGADEYQVRAAVSWLQRGRIVRLVGKITRRDRSGRPYTAALYRWTGIDKILTVHRDQDRARAAREGRPIQSALSGWDAIIRRERYGQ